MATVLPPLPCLHCLAGTRSGLLVSRSATKGLQVFRMPRDDAYLELLLRTLSRVWVEHAQRRRLPPPNIFHSWHDYHTLLTRTVAVSGVRAREAACSA